MTIIVRCVEWSVLAFVIMFAIANVIGWIVARSAVDAPEWEDRQ